MYYNMQFGKETLSKEYKSFTFNHIGIPFDMKKSEYMIKSGFWNLNNLIKQNFQKNVEIYLPKYISAFMNPLSEVDFGELYFGIEDDGTVCGIPFQGELDSKFINKTIISVINKHIKVDNMLLDDINKYIKYTIIELNYDKVQLEEPMPLIEKFYELKQYEYIKELKYKKELEIWHNKKNIYIKKLTQLFNEMNTRNELYNYIQSENPNSIVLKMMDNGYMLPQETYENVNIFKYDVNNPFYWLCKWKDEILEEYKKNKPIMPLKSSMLYFMNPNTILTRLTPMIPWWMQKNKDMKLYVIRITIRKPVENMNVQYIDMFGSYNMCYRTTYYENGTYYPCCDPVY